MVDQSQRISSDVAEDPNPQHKTIPGSAIDSRERFLRACHCQAVDRPPVWLMRQAGRVLPEYRALKEKYSFAELIQTPDLAAEVTVQPVRRFGFDAAILFSDILVIPEAMGQPFQFRDKGGVQMAFGVRSAEEVGQLVGSGIADRLQYVGAAIRLTRKALGPGTALIGFAGSPWTLANFMIEGGSARDYSGARRLFYTERGLFDQLCQKLTGAVIEFLQMQIAAGVDALQIFDSLGHLVSGNVFEDASGRWLRQIVAELKNRVPVIVFAKGAHANVAGLAELGAQVLGVDWTVPLSCWRRQVPANIGIQGNLDPLLLETTPEAVEVETRRILLEMRGRPGHIFNLGHGVPPSAKLECIESLVRTVRNSHEHA
jgi:uroporphyrinogen decarboxylase